MKKVYLKDVSRNDVFYFNSRKNALPYMRSEYDLKGCSFILVLNIARCNEYKIIHPYQQVYIIEP